MSINIEKSEKSGIEKEPILKAATQKEIINLVSGFGNLELPASASEGFLYVGAKYIKISPSTRTIEIREPDPEDKIGVEKFDSRDEVEKAWPKSRDMELLAEKENKIFEGVKTSADFHPEIGGRICLSVIQTYRTADKTYITIPVLPETEQKYGVRQKYAGHAKLTGNILRSPRFPSAKEVLRAAVAKETHNLAELQKIQKEKIVSRPRIRETGLWNVHFMNAKGEFSDIRNCHIQRDPETGTLDLFLMQEEFVFQELDRFRPQLNLGPDLKRVNMLVDFDELKATPEGCPLQVERLYFDGEEVADFKKLPTNYQNMFEEKDGKRYLQNLKETPPLRAILKWESQIVKKSGRDVENDIREKIGELFEKVMEKALGKKKNEDEYKISLPSRDELRELIKNQPQEFQDWAKGLKAKEITVVPDFVLGDGTFIEVKAGGKMEHKPKKRDQLFRMILYKLLTRQEMKVRMISLTETSQDPVFDNIKYENVFDTEWKDRITERDLKPIRMWQRYLSN